MKTLIQFLFALLAIAFTGTTLAATSPVGATPGSFAVSPSGAATYSIPIQVPPGVGGMQPNISLSYNSQGGNSIAGVGWNIGGLSAITRCGATIDRDGFKGGVNLDWNDRYCLDGQRLINISGAYGGNLTEYRTEIENFSKIISYGTQGNGPAYFIVTSKNGVTTEYGNGNGAQQFAQNNGTVLTWQVSRIKDVAGNSIQFFYTTDSWSTGEHRIDQIYYTHNGTGFVGGVTRSVKFNYGSRTDVETSYVGGSAVKVSKRLADYSKDNLPAVRVTLGSSQVREYRLSYDTSAATQRSRLAGVQECVWDTGWVCLPATKFINQEGGSSFGIQRWATQQGGYWSGQRWFVGDFDGDGKLDFAKIWNDNNLMDIDVHLATANGFVMQRWATQQGSYIDINNWFVGDFDGDGKTDFAKLWNDNNLTDIDVHLSTGNSFVMQRWATQQGGYIDAQNWFVGDFNGDGKTDFAKYFNDNNLTDIDVHLSTGSSFVMQRWATQQGGYWSGQKWFVGDFDGDGKTDFAKLWNDNNLTDIDVHLSTGNSFVMQRWATQQGGYIDAQNWFVGDFNGDGKTDFAKYFNDNGLADIDVHVAVGPSPDKLLSLTNGLNAQTSLTYKPLTDPSVYTKETTATYPVKDYQPPLYVVSAAASSNGIGGLSTTKYAYAGMKEHQTGRGNLGFRKVTITAPDGAVNTTEYSQTFPYIGMVLNSTTTVSGVAVSTTTNTPASANSASGRPMPYVSSSVTITREVSSNAAVNNTVIATVTSTSGAPDGYGNVATSSVTASDGFVKTSNTVYYNDVANWRLGLPVKTEITSTLPLALLAPGVAQTQTRTTVYKYAFDPVKVNYQLIEEVAQPATHTASPSTYLTGYTLGADSVATIYTYDPTYGYRTSVTARGLNMTDRTTRTAMDFVNHTVTTTNALGHAEIQTLDPKFGVPVKLQGPNQIGTALST